VATAEEKNDRERCDDAVQLDGEPPPPISETDRNDVMAAIRELFLDGQARPRDEAIRDLARALGYQGSTNQVLVVECKSYIDSRGVMFRHGNFEPEKRYKLFTNPGLRSVALNRLALQLQTTRSCAPSPTIKLCLAAGNIAAKTDREELAQHFEANNWGLFDEAWVRRELRAAADTGYENDVAFVVSKLLLRGGPLEA
jgi:hypothetical protein